MKRSKHSLSNYKLLSCDQGQLVPIGLQEILPGDTFDHSTSALIRVAPLATPVMHPVRARIHHFFVPHRLVWNDWEDFITGGPDGLNASVFPTINTGAGFAVGSLADYLGVTPSVANRDVSALPFRAYALIYNEFYRDQDLNAALTIDLTDGPDTTTNVALQNACWERDRFTLARATAQKGAAVTLPLGTTSPVKFQSGTVGVKIVNPATGATLNSQTGFQSTGAGVFTSSPAAVGAGIDPNGSLYADLSTASAATITQLRTAFALQQYAENRSLYGSRYSDYLALMGVKSSDARLQRPEYLGGGVETIQFSEVIQTAPGTYDTDEYPLGNLGGHGIGALKSNRYRRFFEEHGYVISLLSVLPKTVYAQGLEKTWNRRTKEDFFQYELQFVGQDEVQNKEVYLAHTTPDGTFGYIDRYDDYRRSPSTVAGEFRTTLDSWHMARIFSGEPALNSTFVTANPTDRIYASTTTNELQIMVKHKIRARRPVAKNGTPRSF
ncbi:major capsid protein [Apis mellifera associated microvirus 52]|nr:major capsid protein [Apis mellifera associated microvirus 52]